MKKIICILSATFLFMVFNFTANAQSDCYKNTVAAIYDQVLERTPESSEGWSIKLSNGSLTVKETIRRIASSPEYEQRFVQGKSADVVISLLYRHLLDREVDSGANWSERLKTKGFKEVVDGIVDSKEYTLNFGEKKVPGHTDIPICRSFPWKRIFETTAIQHSDTWSEMTISKNGRVDYHISIKNRDRLVGACIRFFPVYADEDGNIIKTEGTTQFCVDGRFPIRSRSQREDFLVFQLTPEELAQLGKVTVVFSDGGKNPLEIITGNLEKVQKAVDACPFCKMGVIAAF